MLAFKNWLSDVAEGPEAKLKEEESTQAIGEEIKIQDQSLQILKILKYETYLEGRNDKLSSHENSAQNCRSLRSRDLGSQHGFSMPQSSEWEFKSACGTHIRNLCCMLV